MDLRSFGNVSLLLLLASIPIASGVPAQVRRAEEHLDHNSEARQQIKGNSPSPRTVISTTDEGIPDGEEASGVLDTHWSGFETLVGSNEDEGDSFQRFQAEAAKNWQDLMGSFVEGLERRSRGHAFPNKLTRDAKGYWKLTGLNEDVNAKLKGFAPPPRAASMVVLEHVGRVFWMVTQDYTLQDPGSLHVYMLIPAPDVLESTSVPTLGANHCRPVLLKPNFIEVVCVETLADRFPAKNRIGTGIYRVTWDDGLQVTFKRGLLTHGAKDVAIWDMAGVKFLAFANSYDFAKQTGEINSVVFRVKVTEMEEGKVHSNYDMLESASVPGKHAMGVETFEIQSRRFLALANHKDDKGNVKIDSQIFIYDLESSKFRSFQRIQTSAARDWTAFNFTNGPDVEYFLAVANEYSLDEGGQRNYAVESVIYRYQEFKFVPFQCVQTYGALHWAVYQGTSGEFLLAVANSRAGVFFYQYNGWTFVRSNFRASSAGVERVWMSNLPSSLHQVVITVSNPFHSSNRPIVLYAQWIYHNPLTVYHSESHAWCESFKATVNYDELGRVLEKVETCSKSDENYSFARPVVINGDLGVSSQQLVSHVDPIVVGSDGVRVTHLFTSDVARAFTRLSELAQLKNHALRRYQDSKQIQRPNLDGHLFSNLKVKCSTRLDSRCWAADLVVVKINAIEATYDNAIWLTRNNGALNQSFVHVALSGRGASAKVLAFQDGADQPRIPASNLVSLVGNHVITGEKTFSSLRANAIVVSGTVDGVVVEPESLLLTVGEQHAFGTFTFQTLEAPHIDVNLLNGHSFTHFYTNLALKDVSQQWTGLTRVGGHFAAPSVVTTGTITPLDPVVAKEQALLHTTTALQIVTGLHSVGSLEVENELTVSGFVNGVRLPEEVFLRSGPDQHVHSPATFVSIAAQKIFIHSNLNHIQQVEGRLALLLLEGNQILTSKKIFRDLHILGHSFVGQTVAGHYLQDLSINLQKEFLLGIESAGREVDGSLTFHDALYVDDDTVEGVRLTRITEAAIPLSATRIDVPLSFHGVVQVDGDVFVSETLNRFDIDSYVLHDGGFSFNNKIVFKGGLRVDGDVTTGKMFPFDVGRLATQILLKHGNHTVHKDVYFIHPVVDDLEVEGQVHVNGVDLDDVVTLSGTSIITGRKTLTEALVQTDVIIGALEMGHSGLLDGVNIDELFFTDTLRRTPGGMQTLTGRNVHWLVSHTATGTDLGIFERTAVYRDGRHYIDGSLHLTGTVTVEILSFGRDFDGVSADSYSSDWLLKDGDQTLRGRNTLLDVRAGAVTFEGVYLQTVHWERLLHLTAKVDETATVERASFGLLSAREVVLSGSIQGWDLSQHALTASAEAQKITGRKTFLSMVFFSGKFDTTKGLVVRTTLEDDPFHINLRDFIQTLALGPSDIHINSLTIKGNATFGDVIISGHLNGEDATTLTKVFWQSDLPASISSVTSFSTIVLSPGVDLRLKALINGVDVETLSAAVLRQECDRDQVVTASFAFDSLTVTNLKTDAVDTSDDQMARDLENLLLTDGHQVFTGVLTLKELTAEDSVRLDGTVNGLKIEEMVRRGHPASITGRKVFLNHLFVQGHLNTRPYSEVQGVDVSEFSQSVVVSGGERRTIPGVTTFRALRIQNPMRVGGTVDGVPMNRNSVLLRTGPQTMSGLLSLAPEGPRQLSLVVYGPFTVNDNKFNDVDLRKLGSSTVRSEGAATVVVRGGVRFLEEVRFAEVGLPNHLVDGYNITDLALCLSGQHVVNTMAKRLAAVQEAAMDVQDILSERVQDLWYYKSQSLSKPLHKLQPLQEAHGTVTALIGLDRSHNLVHTYNISTLNELYPAIGVDSPRAAVGLDGGLLAVCGDSARQAFPTTISTTTSTYTKVGDRGSGYGYVYQLGGTVRLEASFGVTQCKDLVSFEAGKRPCLAVMDYEANSTVMCRSPGGSFFIINYLATTRALKGALLELEGTPYLLVVEGSTATLPSYVKFFRYDQREDQMVMIHRLVVLGANWISALSQDSRGLVAITSRQTGQVMILQATTTTTTTTTTTAALSLNTLQTVEVEGAVHSSLALMPTGQIALYVQTRYKLLLFLLKGASFVFHRKIGTTPALHPFSSAFLHEASNTAMVAYTGVGLLQMYNDLPYLQLATPTLFSSVYKPLYIPNRL